MENEHFWFSGLLMNSTHSSWLYHTLVVNIRVSPAPTGSTAATLVFLFTYIFKDDHAVTNLQAEFKKC
jgi:hypothetical protein